MTAKPSFDVILRDGVRMRLAGLSQVFSFLPADGGPELTFCIPRLIALQREQPAYWELLEVPIATEDAAMITKRRGIEPRHLTKFTPDRLYEPGHAVFRRDGSFLVVDGNHRYVGRASYGLPSMQFYACRLEPHWQPALINMDATAALWNGNPL